MALIPNSVGKSIKGGFIRGGGGLGFGPNPANLSPVSHVEPDFSHIPETSHTDAEIDAMVLEAETTGKIPAAFLPQLPIVNPADPPFSRPVQTVKAPDMATVPSSNPPKSPLSAAPSMQTPLQKIVATAKQNAGASAFTMLAAGALICYLWMKAKFILRPKKK